MNFKVVELERKGAAARAPESVHTLLVVGVGGQSKRGRGDGSIGGENGRAAAFGVLDLEASLRVSQNSLEINVKLVAGGDDQTGIFVQWSSQFCNRLVLG